MRAKAFYFLLITLLLNPSSQVTGQSFDVIPLPATRANNVSPDGKAVSGSAGNQAFIWTEEDGLTILVSPPEFTSFIIGDVANEGMAAAISYSDRESFKWTSDGSMVKIAPIVERWGGRSRALGISADGSVVVGHYEFGDRWVQGREQPFRWTEVGGIAGLGIPPGRNRARAVGVSSDGNVVAVQSEIILNTEGFRWTAGSGMVSIGHCVPLGISADGNSIVGHFVNNNSREAFRWSPATGIIGLGHVPGHIASEALAVSGNGNVVVGRSRITNEFEAAIWTENGPARLLQDVLTNDYGLDLTGWRLWQANDISEDGSVVVGWGTNPQNQVRAFRAVIKADEDRPLQVNSTADRPNSPDETNCDTGQLIEIDGVEVPECTLRAALEAATARGGENTITFNIPGSGVHTISLQHALPVVPSQTILDATTQPGYNGTPLVAINGSSAIATAFTLSHQESAIKGLSIGGFTGSGILINGGVDNRIEQCFIGVAPDGVTPTPNGTGIHIMNGQGNLIGDPEAETANLISANLGAGVSITGEASRENMIAASFIGTDISGTMPLPNQGHGIHIDNAPENTIGGQEEAARNLISGNVGSGVVISGSNSTSNQLLGNFIGVNLSGNDALPNGEHGVLVQEGASENSIGATTGSAGRAPGNLISGNTLAGVMITGSSEKSGSANRIQGNIIGMNAAGSSAIPNGEIGVHIQGAVTDVAVGGESPAEGNVIAGHSQYNIWVEDQEGALPLSPLIANNLVGTSSSGNTAIAPGAQVGVLIGRFGALVSQAGVPGYKVLDNTIAANNTNLAVIGDFSEMGEILGNNLGLLQNGNIPPNDTTAYNLFIVGGRLTQIGQPDRGNNIGGAIIGMLLAADESIVAGNNIGLNPQGNQARPNQIGIMISGGIRMGGENMLSGRGRKNIIGAALDESGELQDGRNIIAGNTGAGILIANPAESPAGKTATGTNNQAFFPGLPDKVMPLPDIMAKNLVTMEADSNVIIGNRIGLSASGLSMGNGRHSLEEQRSGGIEILRGNGNMVLANEIGSNGIGIAIYRDESALYGPGKTIISGNYIGSRPQGQNLLPRPNQSGGIITLTSSPVVIGYDAFDPVIQLPNYIAHNDNYGIMVRRYSDASAGEGHVSVRGNIIGMNDKGPYIVAVDEETSGGDIPGIPNFPELLSATIDSLMVKITGTAETTGMIDFYSGEPDHYEITITSRRHKTSFTLTDQTAFAAEGTIEELALQEGAYISATLSIGSEQQGLMTSHFSPAIRVAKSTNVVQAMIDGEDTGDLLSALGISTGKEEGSQQDNEKAMQGSGSGLHADASSKSDDTPPLLVATLHELAPEFNSFSAAEAISAGGTHYVAPDTLFAGHYWTLAASNVTTSDFYVCLDISALDTEGLLDGADHGHPGGHAAHLVVLQRSHTGTPWQARDTYFNHDSTAICARGLYPTGDFAIGYNSAGETSGTVSYLLSLLTNPDQGGSVSGAGSYTVGDTVTLNATPLPGYAFAGWLDARGSMISNQQQFSFSMPASTLTLTASFVRIWFMLTFDVTDIHGNPVEGAVITLGNIQQQGQYSFHELTAGTYQYTISAPGFFPATGSVAIHADDLTLVVVLETDNTSVADRMDEHLRVFPNPASEHLTIMFSDPGNSPVSLSLLDLHGRQVYHQAFDQSGSITTQIDLQGLAPGIYLLRAIHRESMAVRKIQVMDR